MSCLEVDENGECRELIVTAKGGNKRLDSKTFFAKMYITAFPLRASIVWDDCEDRALLYDHDILKLVNANRHPEVTDKVLLRKQLRCLHGASVSFQFWRMEPKQVPDGWEEDDKGNR